MVCLLCSVFKGLSRCFISNSYIIPSSYDVCQQNVLKKFFVVLYKRYRVDDLNIISLDLSHCQQEFEISFFISLSPSTSNLYILPLIGSLVNDIPIYFSIFLQMFIERLILRYFYGSEFVYHLASLVIFLAMLIYHLKRISVSF